MPILRLSGKIQIPEVPIMQPIENFINKIICGDCLEVMKEIPNNIIDLVITDPPYSINYESGHIKQSKDKNYSQKQKVNWDNFDLKTFPFNEIFRILKNNSHLYVFMGFQNLWKMPPPDRLLIWDKINECGMGDLTDWGYSFECILLYKKGKRALNGKREPSIIKSHKLTNFKMQDNIKNKILHPSEKPLKIITKLIEKSSNPNNIILDPFLGSGTTAVACKMLNRNFIGIEKNPDYCKIAEKRLANIPQKLSWFI